MISTPKADKFYMPAEYAKHRGCVMIWPVRPGSWPYGGLQAKAVFSQIAIAIAESEEVWMLADEAHIHEVEETFEKWPNIHPLQIETNDAWARDVGPTCVVNGKKDGKGIEKTNEYNYEGDFENDLKHGRGKIIFYNNISDTYEGQFKNGEITGKGLYIWKNEHTYFGDFLAGKMHGKGIYKWPDGNQYEGQYINGIKEGYGEFRWADGRIYRGPFEKGKQHGFGKLTVNGRTFDAQFEKGKYIDDKNINNRSCKSKNFSNS